MQLQFKQVEIQEKEQTEREKEKTDRLLVSLSCDKVFNAENPFPWMDLISIQGKTNFFERRVGDYQKAGSMTTREEQTFSLEADF